MKIEDTIKGMDYGEAISFLVKEVNRLENKLRITNEKWANAVLQRELDNRANIGNIRVLLNKKE